MSKQYLIPHNYTNNGRVFNLFDKKDLIKALIWFIPISVLIFRLPINFNAKLFWEVIIAFPPTIAILAGYTNWVVYIIRFVQNRRVYYNVRKGNENAFCYQKLKEKAPASK